MIIRELITKFGFDVDNNKLRDLDRNVEGLKRNLRLAAFAVTALVGAGGAGMVGLSRSAARAGLELKRTADATDISTRTLQGLHEIAGDYNLAQTDINTSLAAFSRRIGAAALGNKTYADTYRQLGINIRNANGDLRSNDEILQDVLARLAEIDDTSLRTELADRLFSETGRRLADFLKDGRNELAGAISDLEKFGFIWTEEALQKAIEFDDQMGNVMLAVQGVKHEIGAGLFPVMQNMILGFLEWFRANRALIVQNLTGFITQMGEALRVIGQVLGFVGRIIWQVVEGVGGLGNAVRLMIAAWSISTLGKIIGIVLALTGAINGVGTAALVAQAKMLLIPLAIIAAVAAFAVLVQDVWKWVNDQPSLIGKFLGPWSGVKAWFGELWEDIRAGFDTAIEQIKQAIMALSDWLIEHVPLFRLLDKAVEKAREIAEPFVKQAGGVVQEHFARRGERTFSGGGGLLDALAQSTFGGRFGSGLVPAPAATSTRRLEVNSNISLQVPSGTPAEQQQHVRREAQRAVREQWDAVLRDTRAQTPGREGGGGR